MDGRNGVNNNNVDQNSVDRNNVFLKDGERLDDLIHGGMKIIQHPDLPGFAMDAVLLANFAPLRKGDRVIDLGTGTGVITLLLADCGREMALAQVTGVEIRPEMADMARRSIAYNGLENVVEIIEGDMREAPARLGREIFDMVTVNPPYQPGGSGKESPSDLRATARHEVCCSLEEVLQASAGLLKYGGRLAMIHRPGRLADIFTLGREKGLEPKKVRMVHPYAGSSANLVLVEARKGGRPDLEVLPPLVIYAEKGRYSEELLQIYFGPAAGKTGLRQA